MERTFMSEWPEHVRLRVVTDKVRLSNIAVPVPKREYDAYIDWQYPAGRERRMITVQLIIDQDALAQMGRPEGIPSMQGEVLQYQQRGDIERVE
jgi:hypothetical protein